MMKEMFMHEIRKCVEEIHAEQLRERVKESGTFQGTPAVRESSAYGEVDLYASEELLLDTVMKLMDLSYLARRKGILELEHAVGDLPDTDGYDSLKHLVMLVVDGTDPELIEEMVWLRHFSSDMKGYGALQHLLMMMGTLDIQAGVNPRITEEKLILTLPDNLSDIAREYSDKKRMTDSNDVVDGDTGQYWLSQDEIRDMLERRI